MSGYRSIFLSLGREEVSILPTCYSDKKWEGGSEVFAIDSLLTAAPICMEML